VTTTPFLYYTNLMKRIILSALLLICLLLSPLWGALQIKKGLGISIEGGFYGSIPSEFHEDPLPMRSHGTFGATIRPVIMGVGKKSELSLGLATFYTTRSIVYGATSWRPSLLVGASFSYAYNFNSKWSLSSELFAMASVNLELGKATTLFRVSVAPIYTFGERHQLALAIPLSVDFRSDYIAVASTFSLNYRFAFKGVKK
jgi:hypothetical protein